MPEKSRSINLTARDYRLLRILLRGPHTARQLCRVSARFERPFANEPLLLRRLRKLRHTGLVQSWRYAAMIDDGPLYFKLTRVGHRLMAPDEPLPSDSFFREIKLGSQQHTFALYDVVSRIDQDASQSGYAIEAFRRDREVCLRSDEFRVWPDAAFTLVGEGNAWHFLLEIDCGTEPILSTKQRSSLSRQVLGYSAYSQSSDQRFRVLTVFCEAGLRLSSYLNMVEEYMHESQRRTLFYAVSMDDFVRSDNVLRAPMFIDNRRLLQSMIPTASSSPISLPAEKLATPLAFC